MHLEELTATVELPEGVTVSMSGRTMTIKGAKGELSKDVGSKNYDIKIEGDKVTFTRKNATRKDKRLMNTAATIVRNTARGVTEGHTYKLKICSGHFPMNVSIKDGVLEVKNFIGEAVPRRLKLMDDVDVKMEGTDIVVESLDKVRAGNQASAIELLTRRPGFDSRVFQDGIYIVEKDGKKV